MTEQLPRIGWEEKAKFKYDDMISRIPLFHREIAKQIVDKKAVANAVSRQAELVEEEDIVKAFYDEIPKALFSMMVRLMETVGFDHKKYGY